MKLELKHIAPYLPYGLKVSQTRLGVNESYLLYGIKYSDHAKEWTVFIDDSRHGDYQNVYLKGVTPLLRPLSDLTREIEHNGESFVPIEMLNYLYAYYEQGFKIDMTGPKWHKDLKFVMFQTHKDNFANQTYVPYEAYDKLFEWHFDVFNLIDSGLALPLNPETK